MTKIDPDNLYILGIDSALKGLAIAILDGDKPVELHFIKPTPPEKRERVRPVWERVLEIREKWVEFLKTLPKTPSAIWLEDAIIVHASNSVGLIAVQTATKLAVEDVLNMRVFEVAPSTWKKELTGFGGANKNPIIDHLSTVDPELGERLKKFNQQDRSDYADAIGIAKYGKNSILKAI